MKSPVPFLKPKSYYASPIKQSVTKDEIVTQINPPQPTTAIEDVIIPEHIVSDEPIQLIESEQPLETPTVEQPKLKKSKHNKSQEPKL
jgi:hypothetical protein